MLNSHPTQTPPNSGLFPAHNARPRAQSEKSDSLPPTERSQLTAEQVTEVLTSLHQRYGQRICATASRNVDHDTAEDVTQQAFVSIWSQLRTLDRGTLVIKYGPDFKGLVPTVWVAAKNETLAAASPRNRVRRGSVSMSSELGGDSSATLEDVLEGVQDSLDSDTRLDVIDIQRSVSRDVHAVMHGREAAARERSLRHVLYRFLINDCGYSCEEIANYQFLKHELCDTSLLAYIEEVLGPAMVRWIGARFGKLKPHRHKSQIGAGSRAGLELLCAVTRREAPDATVRARG